MSDIHPLSTEIVPGEGYRFHYPPGDFHFNLPGFSDMINDASGYRIFVHDSNAGAKGATLPNIDISRTDTNSSTRSRGHKIPKGRRDRTSRTPSPTSHTRRGPCFTAVNAFNKVYIDGVLVENPRRPRHSRRQRSKDDSPLPTYTRKTTGDADDSSKGSSGGGNGRGTEARTDGPSSDHTGDGGESASSSSSDSSSISISDSSSSDDDDFEW